MNEWSSGKEFGVSCLLFGFKSSGSHLQQFWLELKRKKLVKNTVNDITHSRMNELPSGKEFYVSHLLVGFKSS